MIPTGFVSIKMAFSKLAEFEKRYRGAGQSAASEAAERLKCYLVTGQLQAFEVDSQAKQSPLSVEFWQNKHNDFMQDILNNEAIAKNVVREHDLATILSPDENDASLDVTQAGAKAKGGRLPKYDWDAIWAGIVWLVHHEGLPPSQSDMIAKVQQWHGKSFGKDSEPSRTILQPKIAKLMALFNGAKPSDVFQSPSKPASRTAKTRIKSNN